MGGSSTEWIGHILSHCDSSIKTVKIEDCLTMNIPLHDCPQLESFFDERLPSSLRNLFLVKCSKLLIYSLKWPLPINSSMCDMYIQEVDMKSFPSEGLLPLSLTRLTITCCQNLKQLNYEGINHLPSLTTLIFNNCPNIQYLPVDSLPKSITSLQIRGNCLLLKQRCKKPNGKD
ncbi:unnamed protein product [Vicia faba]|uniref:Leucine-rich repeat domain, L domain-containing protein n=1 Tax=Vicia faba TaxID=3906 RepID=A0AAV0YZ55_VICFA|nr:unnamed protein product [Vicia faba]